MPDGGGYDSSPEQRLFERTGWLQAEIKQIKENQITKADLLQLGIDLDERAAKRDERRGEKIKAEMDEAFKRGIPGTQQLVAQEVQRIQEQDQKQFEEDLKRAGMEYKDDGSIGPKVHPLRKTLVRNSQFVAFGLAVAAAANPEQAINIFRLGLQFLF